MAKAKKKKVVIHRLNKYGNQTECGLMQYNVEASRDTRRGVTCKRCLRVKDAQAAVKKKKGKK